MALQKVEQNTTPSPGITGNLPYVNPLAIRLQIPLLQQLFSAGVPIEGLTIGPGVPSIVVASEYIETIILIHLSFKHDSIYTIQQIINIARANPTFTTILQWTRGRGGGHHSFEDFHQPILQMYGCIRV